MSLVINSFINGKYLGVPSGKYLVWQIFYEFLIFYDLLRQNQYINKKKYEKREKYLLILHEANM